MARALGIIDAVTEADFANIRRIRNTFSHSIQPIAFGHPDIAELVAEMTKLSDPNWALFDDNYKTPRDRYVLTCGIHHAALENYKFSAAISYAQELAAAILASPGKLPPPSPPGSTPDGRDFGILGPLPDTSRE